MKLSRTNKTYVLIVSASSIVFVHGFGGHFMDTWTSEDVCWPRDFLKSKLERARIISYQYEADISQFLPQDDDSVSPCALELLTGLIQLRVDECQVRSECLNIDFRTHYILTAPTRAYFCGSLYRLYCCQRRKSVTCYFYRSIFFISGTFPLVFLSTI